MDELLYCQSETLFDEDRLIARRIKSAEARCVLFNISTYDVDHQWGIWMYVDGHHLLVDPVQLVNSLFKDDCYTGLLKLIGDEDGYFDVKTRLDNYAWEWDFIHSELALEGHQSFKKNDYVGRIIVCLSELREACLNRRGLIYDLSLNIDTIDVCLEQARLFSFLGDNVRVRTNQIQIEEFHFESRGHDGEQYYIGIGGRGYETWYTHWDNDDDRVRHQLESIAYGLDKTEIELSFDSSYTVIRFTPVSVLKSINKGGNGYGFSYDDLMLVEVEPNEFVHKPILRGYCDRKQCVRAFYEGFLQMAIDCPLSPIDYNHDTPRKIFAYNRRKSPVIENYLEDITEEVNLRQVVVKDILTINPDIDVFLSDMEGCCSGVYNDEVDCLDVGDDPIVLPGVSEWVDEISSIVSDAGVGKPYEKDWNDYHIRGLQLAQKFRELLPSKYDLWYKAPFEDKSGIIPHPILITNRKVEKFDACNISYESWQLQCCGEPFKIGDVVHWTCTPVSKPRKVNGIPIKFEEEHHLGFTHEITGIVERIWAETSALPVDPSAKSYHYDYAPKVLTPLTEADGYESERKDTEDTHYIFWGYVVTLRDVGVTKLLTLPSQS